MFSQPYRTSASGLVQYGWLLADTRLYPFFTRRITNNILIPVPWTKDISFYIYTRRGRTTALVQIPDKAFKKVSTDLVFYGDFRRVQCGHLISALNAWAYYTTTHPIATWFPWHGCMDNFITERSFYLQVRGSLMC